MLDTLIMRPNQLGPRSTAEEEQRTAANAFEAHVGGLIEAHHGDTQPVPDYLRQLLKPSVFRPSCTSSKRSKPLQVQTIPLRRTDDRDSKPATPSLVRFGLGQF